MSCDGLLAYHSEFEVSGSVIMVITSRRPRDATSTVVLSG